MTTMTTLDLTFPHEALTKLSTEEAPTAKSLLLLNKEVYANARSVESDEGGGAHGHLGLVMPTAAYVIQAGAIFDEPQHPGVQPVHAANATSALITSTN